MLSEKPWRIEATIRLLLILFICISVAALLAGGVRRMMGVRAPEEITLVNLLVSTLSLHGLALVLIAFFLRAHRTNWKESFGLTNSASQALGFGALVGFIVLPFGWALQGTIVYLLHYFNIPYAEQVPVQALRVAESWLHRLALGGVAIILAPVAEEVLFRGILYPAIKQSGYPRVALWSTAILFALMHQNLPTFIPLVFLAVVWTLLYERTNNLLAPIAAHALFNSANFLMLYLVQHRLAQPLAPL